MDAAGGEDKVGNDPWVYKSGIPASSRKRRLKNLTTKKTVPPCCFRFNLPTNTPPGAQNARGRYQAGHILPPSLPPSLPTGRPRAGRR
jgi:hypothetical protein